MRPYLALIKDSFRAAMASRVLYILLFLIGLLLLALAPLHMRETLDWKLIFLENVKKPDEVARKLVEQHDDKKSVGRIWELLPDDLTKRLSEFNEQKESDGEQEDSTDDSSADDSSADAVDTSEDEVEIQVGPDSGRRRRRGRSGSGDENMVYQMTLLPALNAVIQDRDFYREQDWEGISLSEEAKELIKIGPENLSDERSRRLNRILVARALSPSIETGDTALEFYYAIWKWDFLTTSMTHQQFAQTLTTQLPYYFDKFVLSIGLFIAILVTANMIPETFEPGSLNLLLSKPISRWAMYVAKFFGGCTFILLCSAFLFLGIWLWLGLGMDVWDRAMLFSIPLYVLVFAIYFSVSALVGLVWRSPILAVVITLLFWVVCFAVGSLHGTFATKMSNSAFVDLVPINSEAHAIDLLQQVQSWDSKEDKWEVAMPAEMGEEVTMAFAINSWMVPLRNVPAMPGLDQRLIPAYDSTNDLLFASPYTAKFGGEKKMLVAKSTDFEFKEAGNFPRDTQELAATRNGLVAVTGDGRFYLFDQESADSVANLFAAEDKSNAGEQQDSESSSEDANEEKESSEKRELFKKIGPNRRVSVRGPQLVDFNPVTQQFAVYRQSRGGKLTLFDLQDDGEYKRGQILTPELDFDRKKMSCLLAFKGSTILLAFGNGIIAEYDAETLELRKEHHPEKRSAIETVVGSPDGNYFGIQYRNGDLWILDKTKTEEFALANVTGQGDVNAFVFGQDGKLWVAENTDRMTMYNLSAGTNGDRLAPGGTWYEKAFRLAISPLYKVFPKPGEFYKVVSHLSSSGDTTTKKDVDLRINPLENANPWQPLWSGLGFMVGMLLIASTYFHFKDF